MGAQRELLFVLLFLSGSSVGFLCRNYYPTLSMQRAALNRWKARQPHPTWVNNLEGCPRAIRPCGVSIQYSIISCKTHLQYSMLMLHSVLDHAVLQTFFGFAKFCCDSQAVAARWTQPKVAIGPFDFHGGNPCMRRVEL